MAAPDRLGQYRIETHLGGGQFTDTYRAYDAVRMRSVAIKLINPAVLQNQKSWQHFSTGAAQAADLVHPHITWLWETGESQGNFFLVERFVNGVTLTKRLSESILDWENSYMITNQLARALDFAHNHGHVYGVLNTRNVLVSKDMGAVITDFGLQLGLQALQLDDESIERKKSPYIEYRVGGRTPATDQYSLATILFEMLSGQPVPYSADVRTNDTDVVSQPVDIEWPTTIPSGVQEVLRRAMEPDPNLRFTSVGEFAYALEIVQPSIPSPTEVDAWREESDRKRQVMEEEKRSQAEEAARLVALEQARREIEEQVKKWSGKPAQSNLLGIVQPEVPASSMPEKSLTRREASSKKRRPLSSFLVTIIFVFLIVLIAAGGLWLDSSLPQGWLFPAKSSPTVVTPTWPLTLTSTITLTPTLTSTVTETPTLTLTPTRYYSATPSLTATPTLSPTVTRRPTATPERLNSQRP